MSEKITDLYDVLRLHREGKKIEYRYNSLDNAWDRWKDFNGKLPDSPYEWEYREVKEYEKIVEHQEGIAIYSDSEENNRIVVAIRTILLLRAQPGCGGGLESGWVGSVHPVGVLSILPVAYNEELFPCFSSKELCQQAIDNVGEGCIIEAIKVLSGRM